MIRLTVIAMVLYALVCGFLIFSETRLIFPGAYFEHHVVMDPARFAPDEPVTGKVVGLDYTAVDGASLHGRILVRQSPERVVLFLHGNGIRAVELDDWTRRLSDALHATVLTAEYRGFLRDGFTPSERTTVEDASSALHALATATGTPPEEIVIYGRSLGGGVAAGLVATMIRTGQSPQAVVLDRTFSSVTDIGAERFWFLPVRVLIRNSFDSLESLKDYGGLVIQVHGTPDQIVPMRFGRRLFDSLSTTQKIWIDVPGMMHNDRLPSAVLQQIDQELAKHATKK